MTRTAAKSVASARAGGLLGLCVLSGINLFNYVDRYVVPAVAESLKKDPDLHLTDAQLGWVMTGFIIVYAFASPVFGCTAANRCVQV